MIFTHVSPSGTVFEYFRYLRTYSYTQSWFRDGDFVYVEEE